MPEEPSYCRYLGRWHPRHPPPLRSVLLVLEATLPCLTLLCAKSHLLSSPLNLGNRSHRSLHHGKRGKCVQIPGGSSAYKKKIRGKEGGTKKKSSTSIDVMTQAKGEPLHLVESLRQNKLFSAASKKTSIDQMGGRQPCSRSDVAFHYRPCCHRIPFFSISIFPPQSWGRV